MKNLKISDFGYESGKEKVRIQMRKQNPTDRDIEKLVEEFKNDDFSFYEFRKTDEFKNLLPEVQKEAEDYYNTNTNNTFSSTSSIEVLTNVRSLIEQGKLDEAEKFLDENKDLLAKSDYLNFKDVKIPNAFFSGSDPLLKSPRFTEFMVLAEKHILNTTGQYNVGDAFNRLFDYKDEALEWLRENPLEKYNSKFERKKAFEGFLKEQAKGLNLFQTEVEYKPE